MMYLDAMGKPTPPDGWYGPGHVYVGSLSRGRVCWTPSGQQWKVFRQREGSTLVRPTGGTKKQIHGRVFTSPHEPITVARASVVRLTREVR